ncbi:MAG: DinB family protein [Gemmatimonadales bacterium]
MHPDLEAIERELLAAQAEAHRIADGVDEATWAARPATDSWSMSECVAHLTLSTEALLSTCSAEIARDEVRTRPAPVQMRRDLLGWALSRMMEPPVRGKFPTAAGFIPGASAPRAETVAAFDASQGALLDLLRRCDGIDITLVRVTSPFNARVKYSLFSMFRITAAHQRRHLWQAERARDLVVAGR